MAEQAERIVDTTVEKAENIKVQTADALEEAARKLREADLTVRGQDVKSILNDIECRTSQFKADMDRKIEPVESFIVEHPFASILIAVGVGYIVGSVVTRRD
ncbi:MAG TPA: hypothetical protein VK436_01270 [Methanocella sp.]|nr:hypothetical protein [Methanocella sp.]